MRRLIKTFLLLLLLVTVIGTFFYFESAPLLGKILSRKLGVPVGIESINFSKQQLTINQLRISNPPGAQLPDFLKVEKIHVIAPYIHYVKNPIEVNKIHFSDVYVDIEFYEKERAQGNWQEIIKGMNPNATAATSKKAAVIKELLLTNITVDLVLPDGERRRLAPIQQIKLTDVTTEEGIPIQSISKIIAKKIMRALFLQKSIEAVIEAPADFFKEIFDILKIPKKQN